MKHVKRYQNKHVKDIKIFLKKRKTKVEGRPMKDIKKFLKKKKKRFQYYCECNKRKKKEIIVLHIINNFWCH